MMEKTKILNHHGRNSDVYLAATAYLRVVTVSKFPYMASYPEL